MEGEIGFVSLIKSMMGLVAEAHERWERGIDDLRSLRFMEMGKGAKVVNNDSVRRSMNHNQRHGRNTSNKMTHIKSGVIPVKYIGKRDKLKGKRMELACEKNIGKSKLNENFRDIGLDNRGEVYSKSDVNRTIDVGNWCNNEVIKDKKLYYMPEENGEIEDVDEISNDEEESKEDLEAKRRIDDVESDEFSKMKSCGVGAKKEKNAIECIEGDDIKRDNNSDTIRKLDKKCCCTIQSGYNETTFIISEDFAIDEDINDDYVINKGGMMKNDNRRENELMDIRCVKGEAADSRTNEIENYLESEVKNEKDKQNAFAHYQSLGKINCSNKAHDHECADYRRLKLHDDKNHEKGIGQSKWNVVWGDEVKALYYYTSIIQHPNTR
ncbi:28787_t:CDS:2 [Dentiscutata erythropus]|uniref:28787_t:CDS:1 n=1 Tax=Dentiscutata erythropus TaxID=1348616 RepID=A0A9N8ZH57_9GLOM|nr:28787_t:CDS:2 [Dentiscutata erythropus]